LAIAKLDLREEMKRYYQPPREEVQVIRIPKMQFVMIDGEGEPAGKRFQEAVGVAYGLAYTIKFDAKKKLGKDYPVMPLEGLWWMKGGGFDMRRREDWLWSLMIMQPDLVTEKMFTEAILALKRKRNPPGVGLARLEAFDEGLCVQAMHVGPYATGPETMAKLDTSVREKGYRMTGKHHEIYLGDPRRSAPSKLKTVIRHPITR
jgi:hypothetical protein